MVFITIVTGAYKPTCNWGPHIVDGASPKQNTIANCKWNGCPMVRVYLLGGIIFAKKTSLKFAGMWDDVGQ